MKTAAILVSLILCTSIDANAGVRFCDKPIPQFGGSKAADQDFKNFVNEALNCLYTIDQLKPLVDYVRSNSTPDIEFCEYPEPDVGKGPNGASGVAIPRDCLAFGLGCGKGPALATHRPPLATNVPPASPLALTTGCSDPANFDDRRCGEMGEGSSNGPIGTYGNPVATLAHELQHLYEQLTKSVGTKKPCRNDIFINPRTGKQDGVRFNLEESAVRIENLIAQLDPACARARRHNPQNGQREYRDTYGDASGYRDDLCFCKDRNRDPWEDCNDHDVSQCPTRRCFPPGHPRQCHCVTCGDGNSGGPDEECDATAASGGPQLCTSDLCVPPGQPGECTCLKPCGDVVIVDSGLNTVHDEYLGSVRRGPGSVIGVRDNGAAADQSLLATWTDYVPVSVATSRSRVFVGGINIDTLPARSAVFVVDGRTGSRSPMIVANPTDPFDRTLHVRARGLTTNTAETALFTVNADSHLWQYDLLTGHTERYRMSLSVSGTDTPGRPNSVDVDSLGRILIGDPGWGEEPEVVYDPYCFPIDENCLRARCGQIYYDWAHSLPSPYEGKRCEEWPPPFAPDGNGMGGAGWILQGTVSPGDSFAHFDSIGRVERLFDFVVDRRTDQIYATAWGTGVVRIGVLGNEVVAPMDRPLGIAIDRFGMLYVTDATPALYRVDPSTGEITELTRDGYMLFPLDVAIQDCTGS